MPERLDSDDRTAPVCDTSYRHLWDARDLTLWRGQHRRWIVTSLRMGMASRSCRFVCTNESIRSPAGLVLLATVMLLLRRRNLVLTEFLPGTKAGFGGRLVTSAYRRLLPRVCIAVQVMTTWELDEYARMYRFDRRQLVHIPYLRREDQVAVARESGDHLFCSGRNNTDWPTLLKAHSSLGPSAPPMIVVCTARERALVTAHAKAGIRVLVDIPRHEHDALMATARAVILPLLPARVSCGHVRLSAAATFGVPVVASRVLGISGYERLACTLVPACDPGALAEAMIRDPSGGGDARADLTKVLEYAAEWPRGAYLAALTNLPEMGRSHDT